MYERERSGKPRAEISEMDVISEEAVTTVNL